jgi:hypothetical protein
MFTVLMDRFYANLAKLAKLDYTIARSFTVMY